MAVHFHLLSASGILTGQVREHLLAILETTANKCAAKIALGEVDVVVLNEPKSIIPQIGVNGFSYDAHQMMLFIDTSHPNLEASFESTIAAVTAHELHHCARSFARGTSHSHTYGGSLVAEGLACCFEEEICQSIPFYAVECKGDALLNFSKKALQHRNTQRNSLPGNWREWMFGRYPDDPNFPYQCGYSTGYKLIRRWLDVNQTFASELVDIDEKIILDAWGNGDIDPFKPSSR